MPRRLLRPFLALLMTLCVSSLATVPSHAAPADPASRAARQETTYTVSLLTLCRSFKKIAHCQSGYANSNGRLKAYQFSAHVYTDLILRANDPSTKGYFPMKFTSTSGTVTAAAHGTSTATIRASFAGPFRLKVGATRSSNFEYFTGHATCTTSNGQVAS